MVSILFLCIWILSYHLFLIITQIWPIRQETKLLAGSLSEISTEELLDLVIENKDKSTTSSSDDVRPGTLEEALETFLTVHLSPAIQSGSVLELGGVLSSGHHHHSSSDGVERITNNTGHGGDGLSNHPLVDNRSVLLVGEEDRLTGIVETEVGTSVDDDTLDRHTETLVQGEKTGSLGDSGQAIEHASELALGSLSNISSQTGSDEIQGVHNKKRGRTSQTTGSHVDSQGLTEVLLGVNLREHSLEGVLESEVEGLSGEVSHNICHVTSPQGSEALLGGNSREAVHDTSVSGNLSGLDIGVRVLSLEEHLYALDGCDQSLGDTSSSTTGSPVDEDGVLLVELSEQRLIRLRSSRSGRRSGNRSS